MKASEERQQFDTHFNYILCLQELLSGVKINFSYKLNKNKLTAVDKKKSLIDLTVRSLQDEYKIVQTDNEYSYASTSWLPVKSYYLLFNLLLTIEYIIKNDAKVYDTSHSFLIGEFTKKLQQAEIQFNEPLLNEVYDRKIFELKFPSGSNLSKKTSKDLMYKLVMKKIAKYKKDEWRRMQKINCKKRTDKIKQEKFLDKFHISVFDFPYYMRLRSNYRDFSFIDCVSKQETAQYFIAYYDFTKNFHNALVKLKTALMKMKMQ